MLWLAVKWLKTANGGHTLVLTRWADIPTHFTRREAFRIAPWPGLSQAEAFPDICQEVFDDAAIVLRDNAFLD